MQIINSLRDKSFFLSKKVGFISVISLCVAVGWSVWQANATKISQAPVAIDKAKTLGNFFKMPLTFEVNQGQTDAQVKYLSHGHGYNMFFTKDELVFAFKDAAVRAQFVNANPQTEIAGTDKIRAKTNYLIGNDRSQWHRDIPNYGKVSYKNLYPGIDAVFYGSQQQFEYDIHVAPNADPQAFKLNFQGVQGSSIDKNGDLVLKVNKSKSLNMHKPVIYQEINGVKQNVAGDFVLLANNQVSFKIGAYDKSKELVIDPVLYYSSYFGGAGGWTHANDVAVDADGIVYVVGYTDSSQLPLVPENQSPYPASYKGKYDVFVAKFDPSKSSTASLIYSTYFGGAGYETGYGIAVDSSMQPWITGYTTSANFPCTTNAYSSTKSGYEDVFVTGFTSTGNELQYSTHLGETSVGTGSVSIGSDIAVVGSSSNVKVYISGYTNAAAATFATKNAYQTNNVTGNIVAFLAKFDPLQTTWSNTLIYSTLLGPTSNDGSSTYSYGIAIDGTGAAYIVGYTNSGSATATTFPILDPVSGQDLRYGTQMAFVGKFLPYSGTGSLQLDYLTYLGATAPAENSYTSGNGIAVDNSGVAYVVGSTTSSYFIITSNAYQSSKLAYRATFVTKLLPHRTSGNVQLGYSTYLGATTHDSSETMGQNIAVDSLGSAYVIGFTNSATSFPTQSPYQASSAGNYDAFVTKFIPDGSDLTYSTYLGGGNDEIGMMGIAVDSTGTTTYVVGSTTSTTPTSFPTTTNAYSTTLSGTTDAFVAVLKEKPNICWEKKTITSVSPVKQVDVFDILVNKDTDCTAGAVTGRCVWANARYELDPTLSRAYLSANATAPAWLSCALQGGTPGTAYSAGRFGVNRSTTPTALVDALLPTVAGTQTITHIAPPTSCSAAHYDSTGTSDDTVGLVRTANTASKVYYSKWNTAVLPVKNDEVVTWNGSNWVYTNPDTTPGLTNLRVNYMDGADADVTHSFSGVLFLATSNGLYFCTDYPTCTTWSHNATLPAGVVNANLNRVLYKYSVTTGRSLLIVSSNTGSTDAGLYMSFDNGTTWSGKIVPPEAIGVTYISGFDVDNNGDIYVTWYGTSGSPTSAFFARNYTTESLVASSCSHTSSGVKTGDVTVGGLSIGKLYVNGSVPAVKFYDNNFYRGTANFYSTSILGLTLLPDNKNRMARIYVPSLGSSCNTGGYSIGQQCSSP